MPTFNAVIFDLDGTLVDSLAATTKGFNTVVAPHLGTQMTEKEVRSINGPINADLLSKFVAPDVVDQAVIDLRKLLVELADHILPFPGVLALLDRLAQRGLPLSLLTTRTRESAAAVIHATSLGRFFKSVITADDGATAFPDPAGLHKAATQLGTAPEETLFVTDFELEIQMARKAGFITAAVTWGYSDRDRLLSFSPHVVFDDLGSLTV